MFKQHNMINKKLEIVLGGEKTQLWFNNYAVFELQSLYGVEQSEIFKKVSLRASENYLLLIGDLVKVGIKGHCLAKGINTPDVYDNLTEYLAEADIKELMQVWEVFFNSVGGNVEKSKEDKKKEEESLKMTEQKPFPQTKNS